MRSTARLLLTLVALGPLCARGSAQDDSPCARLEFRVSPALDLYHHVRFLAATTVPAPVASLAPAVEVVRELEREFGPLSLSWGAFEGLLPGCERAADLVRVAARAPESVTLPGGKSVVLRARVERLAQALVAAEPECAELLAANAAEIELACAAWNELVGAKEGALFRHHQERLGMASLALTIPVYLTARGARPGAVTYLDEAGRGVCFVAVAGRSESELFEVVLHEATHALDLAAGRDSLLSELRDALGAAGFDERARPFHDLPHLVMFLQSAESVRVVLAGEHEDYGVTRGVYARMGPHAAGLRAVFGRRTAGELSRAEFVREYVAAR